MFGRQILRASKRFIRNDAVIKSNRSLTSVASVRSINTPAFVSFGSGKIVTFTAVGGASSYSTSRVLCNADEKTAEAPQFKLTDSGLRYRDLAVGTGPSPSKGDEVKVHYTGWLQGFDNEEFKFDSSHDRQEPLQFNVGVKQVIEGWDEALLTDMKVGGKREVIIPPQLGYGRHGAGRVIPANATLYFRMELIAVKGK